MLWRDAHMRRLQGVHQQMPALRQIDTIQRKILTALREGDLRL